MALGSCPAFLWGCILCEIRTMINNVWHGQKNCSERGALWSYLCSPPGVWALPAPVSDHAAWGSQPLGKDRKVLFFKEFISWSRSLLSGPIRLVGGLRHVATGEILFLAQNRKDSECEEEERWVSLQRLCHELKPLMLYSMVDALISVCTLEMGLKLLLIQGSGQTQWVCVRWNMLTFQTISIADHGSKCLVI